MIKKKKWDLYFLHLPPHPNTQWEPLGLNYITKKEDTSKVQMTIHFCLDKKMKNENHTKVHKHKRRLPRLFCNTLSLKKKIDTMHSQAKINQSLWITSLHHSTLYQNPHTTINRGSSWQCVQYMVAGLNAVVIVHIHRKPMGSCDVSSWLLLGCVSRCYGNMFQKVWSPLSILNSLTLWCRINPLHTH